jgi:hypothetical protein
MSIDSMHRVVPYLALAISSSISIADSRLLTEGLR